MARITINTIKQSLGITETYDIVNAIRNSDPSMKSYLPLANADNVAEFGSALLQTQPLLNDFIVSLVDRIGLVVIRNTSLDNQLKKFKKGKMTHGRTIQEIFVDITKSKKYDPEDAEETVFKREIPNVKVLYHERNRQDRYDQTIQDESLHAAFTSWGNFEEFITKIINAVYNSAEVEEFEYMKLLIDTYYAKGLFTVIPTLEPTDETSSKEFIKKLRATARKMTLPNGSRDFNSLAVRTRTDMDDLHLIISADLEAEVDVDVLAKAFNMGKTDFVGHITVIDKFETPGLQAVLIDYDWYMVYDNLQKLETIRNPKGLYYNNFYHVWQTLSVSRFSNAVAFVSGNVKPVTQVISDPVIASLKVGKSKEFTAYVRTTDGNDYPVVWSVEALGGSVASGTAINQNGKLTIGASQSGELLVKATVNIGTEEDPDNVVGESIVTVVSNLTS